MKNNYIILRIIPLSFSLLFTSCTTLAPILMPEFKDETKYKDIAVFLNHKLTYSDDCEKFIYMDNTIYLPCRINDVDDTVFFDTGAPLYFSAKKRLSDTSGNVNKKEIPTIIDSIRKMYSNREKYNLISNLFSSTSTLANVYFFPQEDNTLCEPKYYRNNKFVLGYSVLPGEKAISIRFSDTTLCVYNKTSYNKNGYSLIKSKFIDNRIYIYLTIAGTEYAFLFDTGSTEALIMSLNSYFLLTDKNDEVIEGIVVNVNVGDLRFDTIVRKLNLREVYLNKNNKIKIGGGIYFIKKLKMNIVGMTVLENYDWIIDAKKKKVWFKPVQINSNSKPDIAIEVSKYPVYQVDVSQNKLSIVTRNLSANPIFPLNAIIQSVNGVEINDGNICYYKKLLNETQDWSDLEIKYTLQK